MGLHSLIAWLIHASTTYAAGPPDPAVLGFETCDTDVGLDCTTNLSGYITGTILGGGSNIYTAFFGITFAMLVFYSIKLAITSRSDSATTEAISAYSQALFGVMLVSGAAALTQSFATEGVVANTVNIIDLNNTESIARSVIEFMLRLIAIALTLNIVIQGVRFIVAINEGNTDTARKNLVQSFIGAAVAMLAGPIIGLITPGTFNTGISAEIRGVANFIATIFGLMAVVAIIIAGVMMIVSVDEGLRDRAKKLIITSLVAVGVVVAASGIIQIFF